MSNLGAVPAAMSIRSLFARRKSPPAIWRGMYARFEDVPVSGPMLAGTLWADVLARDVEATRRGDVAEDFVLEHEALLLAIRELGVSGRPVRVLDFGGGAGASYAWLRRAGADVQYLVVEQPTAIEVGERLFHGDADIRFVPAIDAAFAPDVVFVKSVLQYLADYRATLHDLFALNAPSIVLEKFAGVESESYASAQVNVAGSSIAYWFISFDDVFAEAAAAGYERILWRRLPRIYPQDDVPASRRMTQMSTLVFSR